MTTTTETMTWDRLMNGSKESQAITAEAAERRSAEREVATATRRYSCGTVYTYTLIRDRKSWLVFGGDFTHSFRSRKALLVEFPEFTAAVAS